MIHKWIMILMTIGEITDVAIPSKQKK